MDAEVKDAPKDKEDENSEPSVTQTIPDKQTKLRSIPAVVVRNENNDIIEQMDEPSVDFSQTVRRNLKSKLIQRANSPVKEQMDKIQETLSENSESGSEEGLSDSSDTERETATTGLGGMGEEGVSTAVSTQVDEKEPVVGEDQMPDEEADKGQVVEEDQAPAEEKEKEPVVEKVEPFVMEKSMENQTEKDVINDEEEEKQRENTEVGTRTEDSEERTKEIGEETDRALEEQKAEKGRTVEKENAEKDISVPKDNLEKDSAIEKENVENVEGENVMEQDVTNLKINTGEKDETVEKENLMEKVDEIEDKNLSGENNKDSDQPVITDIETKDKNEEAAKGTECLDKEESEVEKSLNTDDFSQFNLTQPSTTVSPTSSSTAPPPPLMIPALGVAVNPASIPLMGQFSRGTADLNTVAMQQFQQFNVQPSVASSSAPLTQVVYTPGIGPVYPAGMNIQTTPNRFPLTNQTLNVIHSGQLPQVNHRFITGVPLGIVPLVQSANIRQVIHPQVTGVIQPGTQETHITSVPTLIHSSVSQPSSTAQPATKTTGQQDVTNHSLQLSASQIPVFSTSTQMQAITSTMQPQTNIPAAQVASTTTIAPHILLAKQAQVKQVGTPTNPLNHRSQVTVSSPQPQPEVAKPEAAPVQQKADASTYVDDDSIDISLVNKVKMFYFQCDKCTFVTKSAQNFRRHYMLHLNYKPYVCSNCGFPSCNKYGFSSHLRNHQECAGQHFVYKKDGEAERQLERNVIACKHHKWVSDEENDKSSKELFGDQRRFRFTSKRSDPASPAAASTVLGESTDDSTPDVQMGVVKKTYSGKKKIRDILGEMESKTKSLSQSTNPDDVSSPSEITKKDSEETKNNFENVELTSDNMSQISKKDVDGSLSQRERISSGNGSEKMSIDVSEDNIQEKEDDSDAMSDIIEPLPATKINSKTSESGHTHSKYSRKSESNQPKKQYKKMKSSFLHKNLRKSKSFSFHKRKKKFARRKKQTNRVQNYEIVDESNILDLPRVRKFKTTFDPSPDLYRRRKRGLLMEAEFLKPSKPSIPTKPDTKALALYYRCPYCGQSADSAMGIKRHAFWVHNMCEYTCNLCLFMSMSKQECLRHCYADHPGTSPGIKRSFCKTMEVEEVVDDRNSQSKEEDENNQAEDQMDSSEKEAEEREVEERVQPHKYPVKGAQDFRCIKCDLKFTRKGIQMHLLRTHNVFMYKCPYCKFIKKNKEDITEHCNMEHNVKISKAVRVTYNLNLGHELVEFLSKDKKELKKKPNHSKVLTFQKRLQKKVKRPMSTKATCPLCGFNSNYIGVQRHLAMKHKLKKLQCGRCGHVTYNKSVAVKHSKKSHKENTPYLLRAFADIETVQAMSRGELKKCGALNMLELKEKENSDQEEEVKKTESPLKVPSANVPSVKDTKDEWVSCPVCFAEKRTLRGIELHMMYLHKICNWSCGRCGFASTDKYVTLQHSVDLHQDEDPMISRALINLNRYLAERNMELDYRSTKENYLEEKMENFSRSDPYKPDFDDDDESVEDTSNSKKMTIKDQDETSHDSSTVESYSQKKAWKRRSCSPKGSDFSGAASEKCLLKKNLKDIPALSRTSGGDSVESDSTEDSFVTKKRRKKCHPVARSSPSLGFTPSSFVVRPKDMNQLNQGFSCVYCVYAAPLRHQVRLHCYDKHTNHPACLMEFQVSEEDKFYRNDDTEEVQLDLTEDSNGDVKTETEPMEYEGSGAKNVDKSVSEADNDETTGISDVASSKANGGLNGQVKRSDSLTSGGETDTDELHSSEIIDNGGNRFQRGRKRKIKFDNPLKTLVHKLNSSQINLEDTFHGSLDDVDSFLNKYGVRTLNMDMLTQQQFSDFIERFGSNLQPV
ncbi:uncharacterized protein LOC133196959 [Saccostrea echinata]|uniref:uncharacterized protein LOC133196959 n=1 Tax=Saccostrea echinata TaxID=191078 RepID=UPI002A7F2513|nr:uncharacterized protein LOC133196959 [Saccostrea echinata]